MAIPSHEEIYTEMASTSDTKMKEYPYPSNLSAASFISVKLSGKDNFHIWKAQMYCLLESHGMLGFIDGTFSYYKAKEGGDENYRLWRRSNAVVKGWILGSLSEQTLSYVMHLLIDSFYEYKVSQAKRDRINKREGFQAIRDRIHKHEDFLAIRDGIYEHGGFHAKRVWDELQTIYDPQREDLLYPKEEPAVVGEVQQRLHRAILAGNSDEVDWILCEGQVIVIDKITSNGNTALHEATSTTQESQVIRVLLEWIPRNIQLSDVRNLDGNTVLHVAAILGNHQAASMLVERDPNLLLAVNYNGQTPVDVALSNMNEVMFYHLLYSMRKQEPEDLEQEEHTRFFDNIGDEILAIILILSGEYCYAKILLWRYGKLSFGCVLMALAQNFPNELNIFQKCIVFYVEGTRKIDIRVAFVAHSVEDMVKKCVPSWMEKIPTLFIVGIYWIIMLIPMIPVILVWPFFENVPNKTKEAKELLKKVCERIKVEQPSFNDDCYKNSLFEATRQNSYEVVEGIINCFPNAILYTNEDDHDIMQYAVINRSEMVYNLLYEMGLQMGLRKNAYQNNLLHLAGKLAPTNKLELISGELLQIQSELQWFKEVKGFVSPLCVKEENLFGETPQMVFTREHKELVIEGEKWLKVTAESYTITAALITTIVFAAAITVPGGNSQDTGIPVFTNNNAFTVFAISDAISLFASITSLLMFLSILTARFAEQDFLYKLPTKLIIGLVTLFISTTAMIIAAGATLYLVFGQSNSKILVTIIVSTCVPIVAFVTLQSRLIIDVMSATYGRSMFGKKRDRPFLLNLFARCGRLIRGEKW